MSSLVRILIVAATGAALAACGSSPDPDRLADTITAADVQRLTRTLSADEYGGRGPDSPGEAATLAFLQGEFERLGLVPMGDPAEGDERGWLQRVPVARISVDPATAELRLSASDDAAARGELQPLSYGEDFIAWTRRPEPVIDVTAPVVFVGYGVVAPEEGWDDYSGDVSGAIVVILVNDPPVSGKFGDEAMTYYGRWTYKFEEAARQGAAGALLVHETEAAGYGWQVVTASWSGPQFHLPTPPDRPQPLPLEGWLSQRAADRLFTAAGLSLAEMTAAAGAPGFTPVQLGIAATAHLDSDIGTIVSHNVLGALPGRGRARSQETVLWTAHWDHLGTDPAAEGDGIYNGALDNATGVAGLLEIAEALAAAEPRTRRSHLFVATTLEEQGLLGSAWYAANPVVPPAETVAAINLDGLNVWGLTEDMTVIGLGNSELDGLLAEVLEEQGRTVTPDPEPGKGYFYRSDHFPLAQVGIPALYTDSGVRFVGRPADYATGVRDRYTQLHYHQPSDEFDPAWDFAGAEQDLRALFRVGFRLAESDAWPRWSEGSEFRAARERSRAE